MLMGVLAQGLSTRPLPDFADVVFLSHFDGSNDATTATDDSDVGATITFENNAKLKTAQKKFGTASLNTISGSDGVVIDHTVDNRIGSGDFTVEFQVRPGSFSNALQCIGVYDQTPDYTQNRWRVLILNSDIYFQYSTDGAITWTPIQIAHGMSALGSFYHVAVCRYLNVVRCFVDGVMLQKESTSANFATASDFDMTIVGGPMYVDEVRITRGAWYRSDAGFTPPTVAFSGPLSIAVASGNIVFSQVAPTVFVPSASPSLTVGSTDLALSKFAPAIFVDAGSQTISVPSSNAALSSTAPTIDISTTFTGTVVKKSSDQTGANYQSGAIIAWDAEVSDTNSWHDTSVNNSRLTVPIGVTKVIAQCNIRVQNFAGATSAILLELLKNGSTAFDGATAMNNWPAGSASSGNWGFTSGPIDCVATDYFEAKLTTAADSSIDIIAARSFFSIREAK